MSEGHLRENNNILKTLAVIAVPIALQSLIGSSLNIVDNLMVGRLGESELNAVGIGVQYFFVFWMVIYGFTAGCSTFMSQYFGARDYVKVRQSLGFAVTVDLAVGVVFFIAGMFFPVQIMKLFTSFPEVIEAGAIYIRTASFAFLVSSLTMPITIALRTTMQTRYPLYASAAALMLNTLLNYILIFGNLGAPRLGVLGAALATVISRVLESAFLLIVALARDNVLKDSLKAYFEYDKELVRKILINAWPTTVNEAMWSVALSFYLAAYSRIGITEGAVVQACNTINNLFYMVGFSIGDAILILVGERLGRKDFTGALEIAKKLLKIGVVFALILGVALIASGSQLITLFGLSETGIMLAKKTLIVYGAILVFNMYNGMMIAGVLRSGGDTKFGMIVDMGAAWFIGVPMAFISSLHLGFPIYLAVLCTKTEELVKALILIKRFASHKWIRNLIDKESH